MLTIDADAHVIETEHTWDYMDPSDSHFRPFVVAPTSLSTSTERYWMIDGKVQGLQQAITDKRLSEIATNTGGNVETTESARQMEDIDVRLSHMDELGIDIQVLQPTIFIEQVTDRPEVEVALCRSYNRWLVDIWNQGNGRLRWVAVLPLLAMNEALNELRKAIQNGACGVFMRSLEANRTVDDPYFFPLYEEASRLDIPIVIHTGNGTPAYLDLFRKYLGNSLGGFVSFRLTSVAAFHSIIMSGIPDQFPKLRVALLEAGSSWLPFAVRDLRKRYLARKGRQFGENILKDSRVWVACESDEDLPYVLKYAGEDNLVIGTDYGHADQATEIDALRKLKDQEEVTPGVIDKILSDNPRALYNL